MKIGCICDDRFPSSNANTQQVIKTASAVARKGVKIDLILPRMWQTFGMPKQKRRELIDEYYSVAGPYGLRQIVTWVPSSIRFHKLSHGITGPLVSLFSDYDVIYTRNVLPVIMGLSTGQLIVFETYKLLAKQYPFLRSSMVTITKNQHFLGVVTHSNLSRENMLEANIPADKVEVLHNGYDVEDLIPRLNREEARRLLHRDLGWVFPGPVAVYTGRIDPDKGMDIVLDMAELCPEISFVFVGATHRRDKSWLERRARNRNLKNVYRSQRVDPKKLAVFMYAADVLLIPPTSAPLEKRGNTVLPIKTFSYLGSGRPIVAPNLPDTAELLRHGKNSLVVNPGDPHEASAALKRIVTDTALWQTLSEGAFKSGIQLTWDARAQKFITYLEKRITAYHNGLT